MKFLHVANGSSVTDTLAAAGVPGAMSIWADPLHEGPVPGDLDDDALMRLRMEHHAGSPAAADPQNDMRRWRQVIAEHHAYDELVLWFEHDLFDQLNLIQLLPFVRAHVPASTPVSLICIGFPDRPDFHGLGELKPHELALLLPLRVPVVDEHYACAEHAWNAFRQPTPDALNELMAVAEAIDRDMMTDKFPDDYYEDRMLRALPYVVPALRRFLQEYPWTTDGLSRTERRLMTLAAEGRANWPASLPLMQEGERFYHLTETSYEDVAQTLVGSRPPLLAGTLQSLTVTQHGRDVLEGRADRVRLCGVDRWLGGVHLCGHSPPWRWDGDRQRIAAAR